MEADLASGTTLLVDRYHYSGCVYSAAKRNPSLGLAWARRPDEGLPRPDVCVFLDIAPEVAATRGGFGAERYENREMQARVRELFAEVRALPEGEDVRVVDGGRGFEDVAAEVDGIVEEVLRGVEEVGGEVRRVGAWPT